MQGKLQVTERTYMRHTNTHATQSNTHVHGETCGACIRHFMRALHVQCIVCIHCTCIACTLHCMFVVCMLRVCCMYSGACIRSCIWCMYVASRMHVCCKYVAHMLHIAQHKFGSCTTLTVRRADEHVHTRQYTNIYTRLCPRLCMRLYTRLRTHRCMAVYMSRRMGLPERGSFTSPIVSRADEHGSCLTYMQHMCNMQHACNTQQATYVHQHGMCNLHATCNIHAICNTQHTHNTCATRMQHTCNTHM